MDDGAAALFSIIIFILVLILFFFVNAFQAALKSLSQSEIDAIEKEKTKKRLTAFSDEPERFDQTRKICYATVLFLIGAFLYPFSSTLLSSGVEDSVTRILLDLIVAVLMLLLILWIGDFLPTKVGERKAEKYALSLCSLMHMLYVILLPLSIFLNMLSNATSRLFRINPYESVDDVTEEEIISMVNEGHEQGAIQESEAEMINNIFELDDTEAADVMTRRKNIIALDQDMQFEEALDFMLNESFSRFPVYQEDIDHITGIIHIKDAMRCAREEANLSLTIQEVKGLMHEALFIPETQSINVLFKTMQIHKNHMVIVVDEYGQTAGIVALEDILEEIVGNIEDEHDNEEAMILQKSENTFLLKGMADLDEVEEALQIHFEAEDIDTLNGFLISLIDKIPEDDDQIEIYYENYLFRVLSVKNKTIETVLAIRQKEKTTEIIEEKEV
jgi:putative hemolysin